MPLRLSERSGDASRPLAKRILIADEPLSSRELLRFMLECSGYEVLDAENGEQVLERVDAFAPHLVILDLQIPKLDGYTAAKALRKMPAFERTPLVALAAALSDAAPERIAEAGFTSYLVKPIIPSQLRLCVTSLL